MKLKIKLPKIRKINFIRSLKIEKLKMKVIFLITLSLFIFLNIIFSKISLRMDLSNGKAYSLSPSTKKLIKKLDKTVKIEFFVSSDIPKQLYPLKRDVIDFLNEYKRVNGNKIDIKMLDPKLSSEASKEAEKYRVPTLQFSQLENDKYAVTSIYFGLAILYKDKSTIIPKLNNIEGLEYDLTSGIYKLTKKELPSIGIIGQIQTFNPQKDSLYTLKKVFEKQFKINFLGEKIDKKNKMLLIFDNQEKKLTDKEIKSIKQYLDDGGKGIFFSDGVSVDNRLFAVPTESNLSGIFKEYGLHLNQNLILSTASEMVNFGSSEVSFLTKYPFWITTNEFNQNQSFFSNVNQLVFPWVSSVSFKKKDDLKQTGLVWTSSQSWEQNKESSSSAGFILNPQKIPLPQKKNLNKFLLIAQSKKKRRGEIILIPSSRFVLEKYLGRNNSNINFLLNISNDMVSQGALSGIRQRKINFYPLPQLSRKNKNIFKYLNIFLLPAGFILYGLIRILKRK